MVSRQSLELLNLEGVSFCHIRSTNTSRPTHVSRLVNVFAGMEYSHILNLRLEGLSARVEKMFVMAKRRRVDLSCTWQVSRVVVGKWGRSVVARRVGSFLFSSSIRGWLVGGDV